MLVLGRLLKSWISPLVLLFLVGCSSTSLVKTYDGPKVDPSRSAILSVSDGIEVLSVNGKEVKKYLLPELDINYQLLPGVNTVTFTHETLWAIPGKKEVGESNAELIVTKPMIVRFNAKVGEVYHFEFESPESKDEARNSVATFKAKVLDSSDQFVTESSLYVEGADGSNEAVVAATNSNASSAAVVGAGQTANAANATAAVNGGAVAEGSVAGGVAATGGVAVGAAVAGSSVAGQSAVPSTATSTMPVAPVSAQGGALPTIEGLKVLWGSASTEEKKEFLKWAFK
ncbi:DUF2057 family protein [Alkalimarinus sediminis]|uniref:DUF2057 domain-containing protein n=1 Tax=Alkalimarinus sediminis TaxID=1632866 RepID=A0A9E8KP86_9ALTE|nr:DUF2057 family protein [Alkalimarinus sediminis]UZW73910.1 DUF2057 domain-containing protein [Alkalimarinus sediminis]